VRREPGHDVGRHAALAVRRVGERHEHLLAVERVTLLDGVADGEDPRVARTEAAVDEDAAETARLETGVVREARLGAHADGRDDEVGLDLLTRPERHRVGPDGGDRGAEAQRDAGGAEVVVDRPDHLGVEGGHHLSGGLDDGHGDAAVGEVLGELEADEAATDDRGGAGRADRRHERVGVLDVAQRQGALDAGDRWPDGPRTGGEEHVVVGQLGHGARGELAHDDDPAFAVDPDGLGPDAHVEAEASPERGGGLEQQGCAVFDDAADVVRQSAVGEGHVAAALDHRDVGVLVEPAQARGGAHAAGDAADDDVVHAATIPLGVYDDPIGGPALWTNRAPRRDHGGHGGRP